jgi:hypothetical protein
MGTKKGITGGCVKKPKSRKTKKKKYEKPKLSKKKRCPIIGITGPAGCGKGTVADYLSAYYGFRGTSFATPLKRAVAEIFAIPRGLAFTEVRELKEGTLEPWGLSPRRMAQLLGTEVGRNIDPQVWVKNMDLRTKEYRDLGMGIVIDDARFENEVAWIRANGGKVIHLSRPSDEDGTEHTEHASEAGVEKKGDDIVLINNGTIDALKSVLDDIMEEQGLAWKLTFQHEEPKPNTEKQDEKPPDTWLEHVQPPVYQTLSHEKVSS